MIASTHITRRTTGRCSILPPHLQGVTLVVVRLSCFGRVEIDLLHGDGQEASNLVFVTIHRGHMRLLQPSNLLKRSKRSEVTMDWREALGRAHQEDQMIPSFAYAGWGGWTKGLQYQGIHCLIKQTGYKPEHDLTSPEVRSRLDGLACSMPGPDIPNVWQFGLVCTSYCDHQLNNGGSRTWERPRRTAPVPMECKEMKMHNG